MLYCPVCKVFAYNNKHKCSPSILVPIKRELRGVVDQLFRLEIPVLSASWFSFPVEDSYFEHRITMHIELMHTYPTTLMGEMFTGWVIYNETVTDDHLPLSCLGYSEIYVWLGDMTIEERVVEIIQELESYLSTRDADGVKAVMLLSG